MNDWTWCFHPPDLADGLPVGALAILEQIATELAALGADAEHIGEPSNRAGGLREFPLGKAGFFFFIVAEHRREIVIVQVTLWPIT